MNRAFVALAIVALASPASAQRRFPPDSLTNLKFFPKTTEPRALINTMRGFAMALGVRCQHCHVGEEGMPLDSFDFASDEKRTKRTARVMLHMVRHINEEHLADVPERSKLEVTCFTCHHGVPRPVPLEDLLSEAAAAGGLDSAMRSYRALRERYYGRAAYDFGEGTLNGVGLALARAGKLREALGLVNLNGEFFPRSPGVPYTIGEAHRLGGDTAAAVAAYRQALERDSTFGPARQRLRELAGRATGAGTRRP